tara:strand:+ start:146 stop:571 length:426 start_codon:yes stop_codon:yes gene_type:complete
LDKKLLNKIKIKRLKIIRLPKGNVMHILKRGELKNWNFNEAYFSKIKFNKIKAWKFHLKMTLNLTVPYGKVKFVFYSIKDGRFKVIKLGEGHYARLTVPPKIWFGFKGISKHESIILNLSNVKHDPREILRRKQSDIKFNW